MMLLLQDPKHIETGLNFIERNGIFGIFVALLVLICFATFFVGRKLYILLEKFLTSQLEGQVEQTKTLNKLCDISSDQREDLKDIRSVGEETNAFLKVMIHRSNGNGNGGKAL